MSCRTMRLRLFCLLSGTRSPFISLCINNRMNKRDYGKKKAVSVWIMEQRRLIKTGLTVT